MLNRFKKNINAMIRCKSGFSLVEIIVCFALLSIIALSVSVLMNTGTKMFIKESNRVSLSYAQQVMVQIEEFFSDCNGICREGNTIFVTKYGKNDSDQKVLKLYSLEHDAENATLWLTESEIEDGNIVSVSTIRQPMSDKVSAFNANYAMKSSGKITGVTIELTATMGGNSYSKKKQISFMVEPICVMAVASGTLKEDLVSKVWGAFEG